MNLQVLCCECDICRVLAASLDSHALVVVSIQHSLNRKPKTRHPKPLNLGFGLSVVDVFKTKTCGETSL